MRRSPALLSLLLLAVAVSMDAAPKPKPKLTKGPIVDWVYFNARSGEEAALSETAEGKADLFLWGAQDGAFGALKQAARAKLETYRVPSESWSLLFNPVPNSPPHTVTVRNKTYFNPFSIREVRFAMNLLMDRKYVADKILGGFGSPMFSVAAPGLPGAYQYSLIAAKLGLTSAGSETRALAEIDAALSKAGGLPDLKGKLSKQGGKWSFNGEQVTVKLLIRSDDQGRLREGRYVADQIEKTGIRAERLEYDKNKCVATAYHGNPADYQWNAYAEGWDAGEARQYRENSVSQMYAPWNGNMPGGQAAEFWNYRNAEIDALTERIVNGRFRDEKEYWDGVVRAQEIGLREAVRVFICSRDLRIAANKAGFMGRFVRGQGSGPDAWPLFTADVKPQKNGQKIIRALGFLPKEYPFMGSWDPVGMDGFADEYSLLIARACSDGASFVAPYTARDTPWRASWSDVRTKVRVDKDKDGRETLAGEIPVPEDAVLFDSAAKAWKKVGPGIFSFSRATYAYKWGKWHTGRPITVADLMYSFAFVTDWMTKDGDKDPYYDPAYESLMRPAYSIYRGITVNKDGTITLYMDYNHVDPDRVAGQCALFTGTRGNADSIGVSWEIAEALAKIVAEGAKSGTAWSFSADNEVDLLDPACLKDLKAKLQEMKAAGYVPQSIRQWRTPAEAAASYGAAVKWIDAHKNAYISNGPFFVNNVDLDVSYVELRANRDPSYPFEAGYWNKLLKTRTTRIDAVSPPPTTAKGREARIGVKVSVTDYPSGAVKPAPAAVKVKLTLVTPEAEKTYIGKFVSAGRFVAAIPAADMDLKTGSYALAAESRLDEEEPDVQAGTLTVP